MRMRVLSQDLSLRSFFTIGPYEKDEGFKELLRTIAQKGLLIYGLIGAILVVFHVSSHVFLVGKTIVWDYSNFSMESEVLILDKILIFLFSSILIYLSRTSLTLKWIRISVFALVWFICIAMLIEDIAGRNTDFTTAYTAMALLFAVVMVPYTGWQTALLSLTVIISTAISLSYLPVLLGMEPLSLRMGQAIFISVVAILLTGTSSQIYINRYEQFRARKRAEELSEILEERAHILEMLKEKSEKQAEKILQHEKLKDRFFANISHEFRTPLTLILGPLQDILDRNGEDESKTVGREMLQLMRSNAHRLLDLINQLLDLSKIDAHEIELNLQEVDLTEFVPETVRAFTPLAESQEVELNCSFEYSPVMAEIDPQQMERVIGNLVSNAIKFTPKGGYVAVRVSKQNTTDGSIKISVKDNGIGIPENELPHIFDRFYQAPQSGDAFSKGTGIGLALVKEIVELHKGSIRVNSSYGEGSEFVVSLKEEQQFTGKYLQPGESGVSNSGRVFEKERKYISEYFEDDLPETADEDAPTVLLIDDNPDILTYLKPHLLKRYKVIAGESSKEALKQIRKTEVDLVISDVMMPDPDGFELCRIIKKNEKLNHIPVILLTAQASEESRIEGLELGADDYISKPFSASELMVRVENLIELRRMLRNKFSEEVRLKGKKVEVTSEDARFLKQVQAVIEEHMENSNFGVDWLADEMNLSTRQLQRKVRAVTDLSAGGYIRMIRLERASQLLAQQWGNVSEIAYKIGFQDAKYFSSLFKQTFGSTPTEFVEERS